MCFGYFVQVQALTLLILDWVWSYRKTDIHRLRCRKARDFQSEVKFFEIIGTMKNQNFFTAWTNDTGLLLTFNGIPALYTLSQEQLYTLSWRFFNAWEIILELWDEYRHWSSSSFNNLLSWTKRSIFIPVFLSLWLTVIENYPGRFTSLSVRSFKVTVGFSFYIFSLKIFPQSFGHDNDNHPLALQLLLKHLYTFSLYHISVSHPSAVQNQEGERQTIILWRGPEAVREAFLLWIFFYFTSFCNTSVVTSKSNGLRQKE